MARIFKAQGQSLYDWAKQYADGIRAVKGEVVQPKKVCHHGISPVNSCSYCEMNLCGRPLRSGRACKRSVFHKEACFAPWPTTVFTHPWDCHCWECDEKMPPEDGDVSQAAADFIVDITKLLERWFTPHKAMTLASSILAHPEDAPEGPYEIGLVEGEKWSVRLEPKPKQWVKWRFEGTEGECLAVRNALNREVRDKGDKT